MENRTNAKYEAIVSDIITKWNSISATVTDNNNPRGSYAGCLVRLAGHDFMDFRFGQDHTGGSDGCLNFNDADNTGLPTCLAENSAVTEYQKHCTTVSLADYVVIQAEAVMGIAATNYNSGSPYTTGTLM